MTPMIQIVRNFQDRRQGLTLVIKASPYIVKECEQLREIEKMENNSMKFHLLANVPNLPYYRRTNDIKKLLSWDN